jgi:1-aminocyclopropane-1-carboxylate deaminase/D-cysteine desulfhydrase-like pyridoxal-dependent ACC family enzyme
VNFYDIFQPSPVQEIQFCERTIFVKRDDLLHADFGGNKARKFYGFFEEDLSRYKKIVSYGGHQSNAMFSLASFAKLHNLQFDYYVKPLPKFLKSNILGNFRNALDFGMNLIETSDYQKIMSGEIQFSEPETLFVKQGGAMPEAESGVKFLAKEIETFAAENAISELAVVLPSGTGATAVYLQKHLKFNVFTVPNVGDAEYLTKQFSELVPEANLHPTVWDSTKKKYQFGNLYPEFYLIWQKLFAETGIEFELLFDPKTWLLLCENLKQLPYPILYIHSGGTAGNASMEARYLRAGF